jgi:hypothetical protein
LSDAPNTGVTFYPKRSTIIVAPAARHLAAGSGHSVSLQCPPGLALMSSQPFTIRAASFEGSSPTLLVGGRVFEPPASRDRPMRAFAGSMLSLYNSSDKVCVFTVRKTREREMIDLLVASLSERLHLIAWLLLGRSILGQLSQTCVSQNERLLVTDYSYFRLGRR